MSKWKVVADERTERRKCKFPAARLNYHTSCWITQADQLQCLLCKTTLYKEYILCSLLFPPPPPLFCFWHHSILLFHLIFTFNFLAYLGTVLMTILAWKPITSSIYSSYRLILNENCTHNSNKKCVKLSGTVPTRFLIKYVLCKCLFSPKWH